MEASSCLFSVYVKYWNYPLVAPGVLEVHSNLFILAEDAGIPTGPLFTVSELRFALFSLLYLEP